MPADFVLDGDGTIALAHHGRHVGDHAAAAALLAAIDAIARRARAGGA